MKLMFVLVIEYDDEELRSPFGREIDIAQYIYDCAFCSFKTGSSSVKKKFKTEALGLRN
jgi:hypothetical protein